MPRSLTMETMQVPAELEQMVALYRERRPERVLEIGSWDGGTLKVWLENAPAGATIAAIDLNHRNYYAYHDWIRPSITLHLHVGSSLELDGFEFIREHAPYDWILVDGDHTEAGVRSDVGISLQVIRPGGLMLIHDITPAAGDATYPPGVVFAELQEQGYETWAYQDLTPAPWSRGIGVVQL